MFLWDSQPFYKTFSDEGSSFLFLRPKEHMQHPRRGFTKEQIYEYAWENEYAVDDNTIRVIISRLRDKIGNDTIKTIRGLGYRLEQHG